MTQVGRGHSFVRSPRHRDQTPRPRVKEVPDDHDYYADAPTLAGAPALSGLKSVAEIAEEKGEPFDANSALTPKHVVQLGPHPGESSAG